MQKSKYTARIGNIYFLSHVGEYSTIISMLR
jgi:hypothetical protein